MFRVLERARSVSLISSAIFDQITWHHFRSGLACSHQKQLHCTSFSPSYLVRPIHYCSTLQARRTHLIILIWVKTFCITIDRHVQTYDIAPFFHCLFTENIINKNLFPYFQNRSISCPGFSSYLCASMWCRSPSFSLSGSALVVMTCKNFHLEVKLRQGLIRKLFVANLMYFST